MKFDKKDLFLKEIDVVQLIITRMWANSFLIKWWTVMLVVGVLALDKFNTDNWIALLVPILFAIVLFWWLDSYFLQQERLYRKLYKWIVDNRETSDEFILDMNPRRLFSESDCRRCSFFSKTIRPLYSMLIILVVIYCYFILF